MHRGRCQRRFGILVASGGISQAAIFQCKFGAPTSKPTRLASSACEAFEASEFSHCLDVEGRYLGPLPQQCPHLKHDLKLIGKDGQGNWKTGPSAAYPPEMCRQIALLIQQHLQQQLRGCAVQGGAELHNEDVATSSKTVEKTEEVGPIPRAGETTQMMGEEEEWNERSDLFHGNIQQSSRDNAGLLMTCRWQNRPKSFSDGGGLNSPGRWAPEDRGVRLAAEKANLVDKLALTIRKFVVKWLPDIQRATF